MSKKDETVLNLSPNDTFDIRFSGMQLHVLQQAIGELPTKFGMPLQETINAQVLEQANAKAEAQRQAVEKAAAENAAPAELKAA